MTMSFAGKTAVVGIGATEFSKNSGRSTLRLAVECCDTAIREAGLSPSQIDGMVSFTVEENHEIDLARNLGIKELTHFSRIHHSGGAACGTLCRVGGSLGRRAPGRDPDSWRSACAGKPARGPALTLTWLPYTLRLP